VGSTAGWALHHNNLRQVVQTSVPHSPSFMIWCQQRGSDSLRLGR